RLTDESCSRQIAKSVRFCRWEFSKRLSGPIGESPGCSRLRIEKPGCFLPAQPMNRALRGPLLHWLTLGSPNRLKGAWTSDGSGTMAHMGPSLTLATSQL